MKLKNKNGFTLVECVVAMAVLAIMSLLLMMILNITVMTRNDNMKTERELDEQVDKIVQAPSNAEAIADEIKFVQEVGGVKKDIESIPKDGDEHIKAEKVYDDGNEAELDAISYDFKNYDKFDKISKGNTPNPADPDSDSDLIYGSADVKSGVQGRITIKQVGSTIDNGDGTKTVELEVSTNVNSGSEESAIKITLPVTTLSIKYISESNVAGINKDGFGYIPGTSAISGNIVRIPPKAAGYVEAKFSFTIKSDDFDNDFVCVEKFFTGSGSGNSTQFEKDATGKFKPVS